MSKKGIPVNGRGYKSGSHYAVSDFDGLVYRAEDLKKTWEGWWVSEEDWEPRHPQDFLRVKEEKIAADEPLRNDIVDFTISRIYNITEDKQFMPNINTWGLMWAENGEHFYVNNLGFWTQFDLSTPYDISTAAATTNTFQSNISTQRAGILNSTGTKFWAIGS
jgi:hypothetical protein